MENKSRIETIRIDFDFWYDYEDYINKKEISALLATFERYEYNVLHQFGTKIFDDTSDINYRKLMNYLDL